MFVERKFKIKWNLKKHKRSTYIIFVPSQSVTVSPPPLLVLASLFVDHPDDLLVSL